MHEVETMFYTNRKKPWHGLGTPVEKALNSKDAIISAGLNWTVRKKKIFTMPDNIDDPYRPVANYWATVRNFDQKVLGIVTDRYKIIQNVEAFDFTDALIGRDVRYDTAGSLMGGKKIWLLAKMPETKIVGDAVEPYLCFTNSHDGKSAVRVCMTSIRVVCNNTLNMALNNAKRSWSGKHTGSITGKLREAKTTLALANDYIYRLNEFGENLSTQHFSKQDKEKLYKVIFPVDDEMTPRQKENIEIAKSNFEICMLAPDLVNFSNTKWQVVQAAADYSSHMLLKSTTVGSRERNWDRIMSGHPFVDKVVDVVCNMV